MGLRFRKSVNVTKGVKLNLNKKSVGMTLGGKGVHYTVNSSGKKTTSVGISGTGLYYTKTTGSSKTSNNHNYSTTMIHKIIMSYAPTAVSVTPTILFIVPHVIKNFRNTLSCTIMFHQRKTLNQSQLF